MDERSRSRRKLTALSWTRRQRLTSRARKLKTILRLLRSRYGTVGNQLRVVEDELAAALQAMPEWVRPGKGGVGADAPRWPKWSQREREAHGFPDTMPLRPWMKFRN